MLAPPKLTKPAGHSKAKLTADSFGTPENLFILLCVQIVAIFFTEIPFKMYDCEYIWVDIQLCNALSRRTEELGILEVGCMGWWDHGAVVVHIKHERSCPVLSFGVQQIFI